MIWKCKNLMPEIFSHQFMCVNLLFILIWLKQWNFQTVFHKIPNTALSNENVIRTSIYLEGNYIEEDINLEENCNTKFCWFNFTNILNRDSHLNNRQFYMYFILI